MAQGRSTKIISMIKWTRPSRLSIKNSLSQVDRDTHLVIRSAAFAPEAKPFEDISVEPNITIAFAGLIDYEVIPLPRLLTSVFRFFSRSPLPSFGKSPRSNRMHFNAGSVGKFLVPRKSAVLFVHFSQ